MGRPRKSELPPFREAATPSFVSVNRPPSKTLRGIRVESYCLGEVQGRLRVSLHRIYSRNQRGERWCIREVYTDTILDKNGKWQKELPIDLRDITFVRRCRWERADDAFEFWKSLGGFQALTEQLGE